MLADVLFPAFTAPYVAMVFFPYLAVAVLISEVAVYRAFNRSVGYGPLLRIAFVSNVVSSVVGCLIAAFLPSGLVRKPIGDHHIITTGPYWDIYAVAGFIVALGLSIWIEYAVIRRRFPQALRQENLLRCVAVANVASYAILLVLMFLSVWLFA